MLVAARLERYIAHALPLQNNGIFMTVKNTKDVTENRTLSDTSLIESAKNTLSSEAGALKKLADSIDQSFVEAVRTLENCKGHVVVSGMGKSGHIARKIAATLASTGTTALYVHPAEASHGDLGMITSDDVVLALSNSGETSELADLVEFTQRFSIPLIAITMRGESTLAQAAKIVITIPKEPEVGSLGLAPTTSTTMMLALGDALAIAALESKGFSKDDFRNFHPGGKLGKLLLRVSDLMHDEKSLPLVKEDDLMSHVLVVMTEKSFGCTGIVDKKGMLTGIITDGDLRRHMSPDMLGKKASDIMTKKPMVISPRILAAEALNMLNEKKRTNLFVVDEGKPVGIIHIHDLLRAGVV